MSVTKPVVNSSDLLGVTFTEEQIIDFFNTKTKQHACPVCIQNNWSILLDQQMEFGLMGLRRDGLPNVFPTNLPAVAVVCNHCGYLRLHAKAVLVEEMKKTLPEVES